MKPLAEDHLLSGSSRIREYLDGDALDALTAEHMTGKADHSYRLWNLLMLDMWHREFGVSPNG
jgi:asparagine synthase (glutamine-hydrolysing)